MSGFDAFEDHDGLGLAELVARGDVAPIELVDEAISRIERLNPTLNAVVHTDFERARALATSPDLPEGPFRGVPFLLKDLMGQDAGQPCTYSSRAYVDNVPTRDAALTTRFKRAGLIILGRTNTPEFGIYGVTEPALRGPCRNPWNTAHTPGGSSGGSAAAVAGRMVPVAHAGDGGGSIRIPAAHCGLVGLKPTRARNPIGPYAGERWGGLVAEHVVSRTVRDAAAMLDQTHGPDEGAFYHCPPPRSSFLDAAQTPSPGALRIAFTTDALFGKETDPDCVRAVEDAAALARELGHTVVRDRPQFDRHRLVKAYFSIVASGANLSIRNAGPNGTRANVEPATWLLKLIADKLSAGDYVAALHDVHMAARDVAGFFADYDVLLTPTAAKPPATIGAFAPSRKDRTLMGLLTRVPAKGLLLKALDALAEDALSATPNTMLFNMTGQPAISLPLHWNGAGLPVGTQWVGRFGQETTILSLAAQLERARPWFDKRPPQAA